MAIWTTGVGLRDTGPRSPADPSLTQVLRFDFAIRKRIALLMNSGVDIKTAVGHATADPELRQIKIHGTGRRCNQHG